MRETRQVHRRGCRKDDTFRDFDLVNPELNFYKYRPSKNVVSPPTSTLRNDDDPDTRPSTLTP
jgi:hypothetical protein